MVTLYFSLATVSYVSFFFFLIKIALTLPSALQNLTQIIKKLFANSLGMSANQSPLDSVTVLKKGLDSPNKASFYIKQHEFACRKPVVLVVKSSHSTLHHLSFVLQQSKKLLGLIIFL